MAITWTKNAGELVDAALRRVQMLGQGQTATAYQWTIARDHLNGLLKVLQTQGPNRWRRALQTVTLVSGTASYVLATRPDAVKQVYHRNSAGQDFWLNEWNYDDYERLPIKTTTGRPTIYTLDRQRTATTIYLWPVPDATAAAGSLRISYERVMEDVDATSDIVDVPQEWLDTLIDLVGARTGKSFALDTVPVREATARGEASLNEVLGYDREPSIRFVIGDR